MANLAGSPGNTWAWWSWISHAAELTTCQIPDRSGLPSAARGMPWADAAGACAPTGRGTTPRSTTIATIVEGKRRALIGRLYRHRLENHVAWPSAALQPARGRLPPRGGASDAR